MAIQTDNLTALEHDWYSTRSGIAGNAPLNDHKRAYYVSKGFDVISPTQAEREWLQSVGSSDSIRPYELWTAACQAESVTVGSTVDECKFNFYSTVSTSP